MKDADKYLTKCEDYDGDQGEDDLGSLDDFGSTLDYGDASVPEGNIVECGKEVKGEKEAYHYVQWSKLGDGIYSHTGHTQKTLDAGVYGIMYDSSRGLLLTKEKLNTDDLIEFEGSITDDILKEIEEFWNSKSSFKEYGFLHRRGYLFYGLAGCGKSGIIYIICDKIIKRNGIVLLCYNPHNTLEMVKIIRKIEPNRHIVVIFEDIDALIYAYGEESVLSFLDGETQADDILNIATTNYPEKLDKRIVSRPRRFDRRIKIPFPNASIRKEFFTKKLGVTKEDDIEKWVKETNNFSFAAMTDTVIQVKCLGVPFDDAIKRIKDLLFGNIPTSYEDEKKKVMGFQE